MNKNDLINELYESGKITKEQALLLASDEKQPITVQEESELDRITRQISEHCIDGIWCEVEEDEPDVLVRFDIDKIVEFMRQNNWGWAVGGGKFEVAPVTHERFAEELRYLIKECVKGTLEQYHKGEMDDAAEWVHETGGIRVRSWIENWEGKGNQQVAMKVEFIAEEFETAVDID